MSPFVCFLTTSHPNKVGKCDSATNYWFIDVKRARFSFQWTECHQYFLISISSTQYTLISSWSNRSLLSGGDSSCSWVLCSCTGPKWWILTHCRRGGTRYPPVSPTQILELSTLQSTLTKGHKQAYFSCKVYLETGNGSWSCVTHVHTSPNIGLQIHKS